MDILNRKPSAYFIYVHMYIFVREEFVFNPLDITILRALLMVPLIQIVPSSNYEFICFSPLQAIKRTRWSI